MAEDNETGTLKRHACDSCGSCASCDLSQAAPTPLITVILELVKHFSSSGGRLDSMGIEAAADGIRTLAEHGIVVLEQSKGNRVVGKLIEKEWLRWKKPTQKW
jgi:hypothetical protein